MLNLFSLLNGRKPSPPQIAATAKTLDNPNAFSATDSVSEYFGYSVAISGNYAIVGAYQEDEAGGANSGKAYIFDVTTGVLLRTLHNPNAYGTSASDGFGYAVALDGAHAVVSAYLEDEGAGASSGTAYVFDVTTGTLLHTLLNPNASGSPLSDQFGTSVGISGGRVIVGAPLEDDGEYASSGKAYLFDVTSGSLLHTLDNPNAYGSSASDLFGRSVAISGNYVVAGAFGDDDVSGTSSGKVYVFDASSGSLLRTISNPNAYGTSTNDMFGRSVAISGSYLIAGAHQEDDVSGVQSGKAYIFDVTTGALLRTLHNPSANGSGAGDYFGYAVAISSDYVIVGAYEEDDSTGNGSGKAYVFDVATGTLRKTLDNPNAYGTGAVDNFGHSVAISGVHAVVGAYSEDDAGGSDSGKAYIFDVGTGTLRATLDNPNAYGTAVDERFGHAVATAGGRLIVGAPQEDDAGGINSGKAYIFDATTGELLVALSNPNAYSGAASDYFGCSVALNGNYAVVGAYSEDDSGGTESGKAYIFNATTGGLTATLHNPSGYGTTAGDYFGYAVATNGRHTVVGAHYEDDAGGGQSGKAYVFDSITGNLSRTLHNPSAYGTSAGDYFGYALAISGNYVIVGSYQEDDAGGSQSGKAYVFDVTTGSLLHTLSNPNGYSTATGDNFGWSVAISGNYAIVGAPLEDDAEGLGSGKAYIFDVATGTLHKTLDNPNAYGTGAGDNFGHSVAISTSYAVVGAHNEDDSGGTQSGKAYVFDVATGLLLHTFDNPNAYGTSATDWFAAAVAADGNCVAVGAIYEDSYTGNQSGRTYLYQL